MPTFRIRHALVAVLMTLALLAQATWTLAGTTGNLTGTVTDSTTGKPVAGAQIRAASPSQTADTTSDAGGHYTFLGLSPDTYTVSLQKDGYAPVAVAGVTIFADQSLTLHLTTHPELRTIAQISSRAAGNLVKPGTTASVYSVNAATQQVVAGGSGGFNLNSAYSAIYAQPGVTYFIGNYSQNQVFYIRGGAYSENGYEYDGVPVNRAFDNYNASSLSTLGQQELQVYTGGSPSGASSSTLSGFINQVIKTGTYPGFGSAQAGIGVPGYYHAITGEAGGANPNRTFSWYAGLIGYNQEFPIAGCGWSGCNYDITGFGSNGFTGPAAIAPTLGALFCGFNTPCTDNASYFGQFTNGPWPACQVSGPNAGLGIGYSVANPGPFSGACYGFGPVTQNATIASSFNDRNSVANFHFGIPHRNDSGRDDVQLLYDTTYQYQVPDTSINANGGYAYLNAVTNQFATSPLCGIPAGCGSVDSSGNPYTGPYPGLCGYENAFGLGCANINGPIPYVDTHIFAPGTSFGQLASGATVLPYYFPNSPTNRALNTGGPFGTGSNTVGIPPTLRDAISNSASIVKVQYTKNFGSNAYARLFGYTFYSDWFQNGPLVTSTAFIDGLLSPGLWYTYFSPDYELATHTRGGELQFADQMNPQNLLRFTANYTTATVNRWNNSSMLGNYSSSVARVTNFTNGDPNNPQCFSATTGLLGSCFAGSTSGTYDLLFGAAGNPDPCGTGALPATSAACVAGAKWLVTRPSGYGLSNNVRPVFWSGALEDELKPNDKLDFNIGVRYEGYQYNLQSSNNAENNFWFNADAQLVCYDPGTGQPMTTPLLPGQPVPPQVLHTAPLFACGTAPSGQEGLHPVGNSSLCGTVINPGTPGAYTATDCGPIKYSAAGPAQITKAFFSPRIGGTYTLSPDTVLRFSAGVYTQPTITAYEQYLGQAGKAVADFDFTHFFGLGFTTPVHDNPVQFSNNYDFSIEQRLHNTDWTMRVTPYYRDTHNQTVVVPLGNSFASGVNVGHQHTFGIELAIQKGDPTLNGWSGQLSYTYTDGKITYGNLPNGTNAIDYLNNYVKAFNALTSAGGGAQCYQNGAPDAGCTDIDGTGTGTVIANPYFNMAQQSLLNRSAYYPVPENEPPSDPFLQGSEAIWPNVISGWFQYRHNRWAIAPNFVFQEGVGYGSPTDTYGIDPRACAQNQSAAVTSTGTPVAAPGAPNALACDFLTASATPFTPSGFLAIPNPFTGRMDSIGQFRQPWEGDIGAFISYTISPKITANVTLSNIYNWCFGGTSAAWSQRFKPNTSVCGYNSNNLAFVGGAPGSGFYWGTSPTDPVNGSTPFAPANLYPFAPASGYLPFQAYFQLQVKL